MFMLPLLLLVGLGVWLIARRDVVAARFNWLWVLAAGLLVLGFGAFGRHGGMMMGGRGGMMMDRGGMMGGRGGMMGPGGMMGRGGMMAPWNGATGWHLWVGVAIHAALIIGAIIVAYFAWKRSRAAAPPESAELQILRMRLAKGEITAEEYDVLRQKLQG